MSKSKWNLGIKDFLLIALSTLTGIIICEIALFSMDKIGVMPDVFRKINADQYNFSPETAQGLYFSHPFNSYELVPSYEHNGWGRTSIRLALEAKNLRRYENQTLTELSH